MQVKIDDDVDLEKLNEILDRSGLTLEEMINLFIKQLINKKDSA